MLFCSNGRTSSEKAKGRTQPKDCKSGKRRDNWGAAVATSQLAESLKEKWAWGQISPQEVQELAAKSCKDCVGAVSPSDLTYLASLGTSGAHKKLGLSLVF